MSIVLLLVIFLWITVGLWGCCYQLLSGAEPLWHGFAWLVAWPFIMAWLVGRVIREEMAHHQTR